jgi:hypothetical protein
VARIAGGRVQLYVCDALGHVRALIDAETGQITDRYDYDAWGNKAKPPEKSTPNDGNRHLTTTKMQWGSCPNRFGRVRLYLKGIWVPTFGCC